MTRVKRGITTKKRHKKLRAYVKGYRLTGRTTIKMAQQRLLKAGQKAYIDRKKKKRNFRALWIIRLNAALREQGITYSKFIYLLKKKNIELDRKIMAQIAFEYPEAFKLLVKQVIE